MNDYLSVGFTLFFGLTLGLALLYLAFLVCVKFFGNGGKEELLANSALAVMVAAVFLSAGYIVSGIVDPLLHTLDILEAGGLKGSDLLFEAVYYTTEYALIALIMSVLISVLGFKVFDLITSGIEETEEIRKGNVNVAIVGAAVVFVLAMLMKFGVMQLIESLVPYPDLPVF